MDWMNLNRGWTEYDYFPPYSKCAELLNKTEGNYTAYIHFLDFKKETEYPGIHHRDPRVHLTLIGGEPDDAWFLRGDLISSVYAPKPLFVGEYSGKHFDDFKKSKVYSKLTELLMTSWD